MFNSAALVGFNKASTRKVVDGQSATSPSAGLFSLKPRPRSQSPIGSRDRNCLGGQRKLHTKQGIAPEIECQAKKYDDSTATGTHGFRFVRIPVRTRFS